VKRITWLLTLSAIALFARPAACQLPTTSTTSSTTTTPSSTLSNSSIISSISGASKATGVIVRTNLGLLGLQVICAINGCSVQGNLDGAQGLVFLVQPPQGLSPNILAAALNLVTGIIDAEPDQLVAIPLTSGAGPFLTTVPAYLYDQTSVSYYGSVVWNGYANQPAAQEINLAKAQSKFQVTGAGIVADIDTGVDPNHPALQPVLLAGYDFTRNQPGGSEMNDLNGATGSACNACQAAFVDQQTAAMLDQQTAAMLDQQTAAMLDQQTAAMLDQQTAAMLDQQTASMLDKRGSSAFGHGTEVMGVIHMVAPTAQLLPLKAFGANGTGTLSNILRAIYYGVQNSANVINMSFELGSSSTELTNALNYATANGVICAASAGNDGLEEVVYPAGLQQNVMGVASTNYFEQRSSFSNYGDQVVWVAAPGEEIVTTYPFGAYSVTSGTSFTSPMVAGTAALLFNLQPRIGQSGAANAIANAEWIGPDMGYGKLDVYRAVSSLDPAVSVSNNVLP
jgi:Subtilase family